MASQRQPIAVVGSGCRFPGGSTSPSSLWELLSNPRDVQKEIPQDRFDVPYHSDAAHHGTTNVRHAYLLDGDMRDFDAAFFNISRKEADSMDPQQRMLLETVYEALESGGHTMDSLRDTDTAVYVGVMGNDYEGILTRDFHSIPTYTASGISRAILSNRISYFFDWHGPSLTIDTACSSSLVAVHQGVQALRSGDSRVAVACGTTMILGPDAFVVESKLNMLSPTGRSQMWDDNANGYARGEGVAAIIMKRLSDAIADGDHIECIIRESGTNQDGRSAGLTVPSSEAQANLIRRTYSKAGLDIQDPNDRPQFFEAHGTGTKAGDPREAEAIQRCFGPDSSNTSHRPEHPLYVGSIKTVIGHTEGAAGLAGLLKASLAIQHGVIPPNLLFNKLSTLVEPFYNGLCIPTSPVAWPTLPKGVPRRVSINSFGFGGANAHVILESYTPVVTEEFKSLKSTASPFTPFVFSAATEASLLALLEAYSKKLKASVDINLCDLAWTLQNSRTVHPFKATFSARTVQRLVFKVDEMVGKMRRNDTKIQSVRSTTAANGILGVFTGQGASWATMGAQLIRSSSFVRQRLELLEASLDALPEPDRPEWRMTDEILAHQDVSRLGEAGLAQPLCTAIQIVLVDLLQEAGITFSAVVGHSSGEIACAYAAGFISAHDAIRIAYYRGFHAKLAGDPNGSGQKGGMLAVGTSGEDAQELIDSPSFKGRLTIAAFNSSASVTLSGNLDALVHAKAVFDEEKKFSRMLRIDKAYHSHHMIPCGDPYIQSLRACGITVNRQRNTSCSWYSSVIPGAPAMEYSEALHDVYWRDNSVNAVLFADAIKTAANDTLNFAIEVGPHPALKGPATQNISDVRAPLPYCGVLSRSEDDIEAFSDALGFMWTHLDLDSVDLQAYENLMSAAAPAQFLPGLPAYQWNHEKSHWHESRKSKQMRAKAGPFHELLGMESPDSTDRDRRWTNILKVSEIRWLDGHALQGQTVFPAAGYIGMALESAKQVAGDREVSLFEIRDFFIDKAISFEDDANFAVETLVTLTGITSTKVDEKTQNAEFSLYACANNGSLSLDLVAYGQVTIFYGSTSSNTLSSTPLKPSNMNDINSDTFYNSAAELGYQYTGAFRGMSSIKRKMDQASALVSTYNYADDEMPLIMHPAPLDIAIQALMVAYSHPEDEGMRTLHVPTKIGCIRVNPGLCAALPNSEVQLPVCAVIHRGQDRTLCGSIDIFSEDGQHTLIQAEDLAMKPLTPATAEDDRRLFTQIEWGFESPNAGCIVGDDQPSAEEVELATLCERMSYFYLQQWKKEITEQEWANGQAHHQSLRDYVNHILDTVSKGNHPWVKTEWVNDTFGDFESMFNRHSKSVDARMIKAVGEQIPSVVRGETTMIEHLVKDNMLNEMYVDGLGFSKYSGYLGSLVKQLVHRYPNAKILEIGAGTGGTTKEVLQAIGQTFSSYTFTDISEGYFEKAADMFKTHSNKMAYKVLDVERLPASQGFEAHSYDIIIAANVLHATSSLRRTLENTRQLLKPGGYLMLFEITETTPLRLANTTAGLSGWWNASDGRTNGPLVTAEVWNAKLIQAGFSGIDEITPSPDKLTWPFSVIVTQAVNTQVDYLRHPLVASHSLMPRFDELVIVSTGSLESTRISNLLVDHLGRFCDNLVILNGLPTEADILAPMNTLISLIDLEDPVFKDLDQAKMDGLRRIYDGSKNIIWVTRDAQADNPYQMASIGFGRAMKHEKPHLTLSHLDLSHSNHNVSEVIAENLLRQVALEAWQSTGSQSIQGLLWSREAEQVLENGLLMVPRYTPNHGQNARLNSLRRPITQSVSPADSVISMTQDGEWPPVLREDVLHIPAPDNSEIIRVKHSILTAINVGLDTFAFLSLGVNKATDVAYITLSKDMSSEIAPLVAMPLGLDKDPISLLSAVACDLMATSLLSVLPSNCNLLVHEPGSDQLFAKALMQRAVAKGVHVSFTTGTVDAVSPTWIRLDARTPRHVMQKRLPGTVTHFLDLNTVSSALSLSVVDALPVDCRHISASDIYRSHSSLAHPDQADLMALLHNAISGGEALIGAASPPSRVISLGAMGHESTPINPATTVIDWTSTDDVPVQIEALDARRLFSKDKTYILVGLSGEIGQSLCEWMAQNGAGCVCLTSRSPNVKAQWLDSFQSTGTIVKVFAMDVSNKEVVKQVVNEIKATCPPIAGVANGAMVLHDVLFSDMSLNQMQQVLRPKIDGTNHLLDVFHDDKLDFLVMFSSVSSIIGNPGQSNYAAACAYMQSLANQRRKRGLAASTIDIGRVVGIGYVEHADAIVKEQLIRFRYMPISEADFHQLFAETIRAGIPAIGACPVVTTAISATTDEDEVKPHWFNDPRFSHGIIVNDAGSKIRRDDLNTSLPVMEQLSNASDMEEALAILQASFAAKLQVILQITDQELDQHVPIIEHGIDSLVAVEVRSWFVKELKVDMPVLKILGGASIADLAEVAMKGLSKKVLAHIGGGATATSQSSNPSPEAKNAVSQLSRAPSTSHSTPPSSTPGDEAVVNSSPGTSDSALSSLTGVAESTKLETRSQPPFIKHGPMTFAQSRYWSPRLLLADQTTFNVAFFYKITGNLRIGDLERAVRTIGSRQEALRTWFAADEHVAYQNVTESSKLRLEQKRIANASDVAREYTNLRETQFDIEKGEHMRLVLLTLGPSSHFLLVGYHHILMDGAGFHIFMADLEKAYKNQSLGASPRSMIHFAEEQHEALKNGKFEDALNFWRGEFADVPPVLPLMPMARVASRTPLDRFDDQQVHCRLDSDLAARIKQMSKTARSTPSHFYLAAFKILLFKLTNANDLTIGLADANRGDDESMSTVGLFLNLLALRFRRQSSQKFLGAITEARNTAYKALSHSSVPFDVLLKELNVPHSAQHSPLFQALFDFRAGAQEKHPFDDCQFEVQEAHPGRTAYDIVLDVTDSAAGAIVVIRTQTKLYDEKAAKYLLDTYVGLLEVFSKDTSLEWESVPLVGPEEIAHTSGN